MTDDDDMNEFGFLLIEEIHFSFTSTLLRGVQFKMILNVSWSYFLLLLFKIKPCSMTFRDTSVTDLNADDIFNSDFISAEIMDNFFGYSPRHLLWKATLESASAVNSTDLNTAVAAMRYHRCVYSFHS